MNYFMKILNSKLLLFIIGHEIRGAYDRFPDIFRMGTFIDSTHMKLESPSK